MTQTNPQMSTTTALVKITRTLRYVHPSKWPALLHLAQLEAMPDKTPCGCKETQPTFTEGGTTTPPPDAGQGSLL